MDANRSAAGRAQALPRRAVRRQLGRHRLDHELLAHLGDRRRAAVFSALRARDRAPTAISTRESSASTTPATTPSTSISVGTGKPR